MGTNLRGIPKCGALFVGIDASLANTAIATIYRTQLMEAEDKRPCARTSVITTSNEHTLAQRLKFIISRIEQIVEAGWVGRDTPCLYFAMEGFSFGDRFQRETMGAVQGVIRLHVLNRYDSEIETVTPRAVKLIACPTWPGWNKANWIAAKRDGKFKASMPPKGDVGAGLFKRFGINTKNEHEADATCVALCLIASMQS